MDTAIPLPGTFGVARLPTVRDVEAVAAIEDPCLRNVRITHTYHLLASAFGAAAGPGANWCSFAVWASRQAGQTIRGEDVLQAMQRALGTRPAVEAAMDGMFRRVVRAAFGRPGSKRKEVLRILGMDAFHRASAAVAAGNLKVFAEIGREFARFLPLCAGGRVDPQALAAFLDGLRPGDPPEGQDSLRRAFSHYAQAVGRRTLASARSCCTWQPGDRDARADAAAAGDPGVAGGALRNGDRAGAADPAGAGAGIGGVVGVGQHGRRGGARRVRQAVGAAVRALLRHAVTEALMTLRLPDGTSAWAATSAPSRRSRCASPATPSSRRCSTASGPPQATRTAPARTTGRCWTSGCC